jgi:hypothetical protein
MNRQKIISLLGGTAAAWPLADLVARCVRPAISSGDGPNGRLTALV